MPKKMLLTRRSTSPIARVFYTITFNANGGVGSMEPQRFEVGVDTALNANAFTSEGDKYKVHRLEHCRRWQRSHLCR